MNTLEDSDCQSASGAKSDSNGREYALAKQQKLVKDFFETDSGAEIIESLNT
jgi:hypothetical protein